MPKEEGGREMITAIKKSAAKHPNSEKFSSEVIDEVFSILQKNQYKINRDRSKDLIRRLIESSN